MYICSRYCGSFCFQEKYTMKESVVAIISENCPKTAQKCLSAFFTVITLPPDPLLAPPVSSHPDMLITIINKTLFCHNEYYKIAADKIDFILSLCGLDLICVNSPRGAVYPLDVGLNTLVLQNQQKLIARRDALAPELLPYLAANTKQGYAGCSSLYIKNTLVTADPSMIQAAQKCDIPVHRLPQGGILLPGYNTGFIGGCGGVWENAVYLFGNPDSCAQGHALKKYCQHVNIAVVSLCDAPLSDFGGIQFIKAAKI